MQKAITILSIEEGLSFKKKNNFRDFIHGKCCPREDEYDDDSTEAGEEDLKKVTFLIKVVQSPSYIPCILLFKYVFAPRPLKLKRYDPSGRSVGLRTGGGAGACKHDNFITPGLLGYF